MKKYILYARVASENHNRKGLSHQIDCLKAYAKQHNLNVAKTISEVASGTNENREGFKEIRKLLSSDTYQGVICSSIDRLSRNTRTFLKILRLIDQKKLEIVTPSKIYAGSSSDIFELTLLGGMSKHYSGMVSERIKAGIKKAKEQGKEPFKERQS